MKYLATIRHYSAYEVEVEANNLAEANKKANELLADIYCYDPIVSDTYVDGIEEVEESPIEDDDEIEEEMVGRKLLDDLCDEIYDKLMSLDEDMSEEHFGGTPYQKGLLSAYSDIHNKLASILSM